MIKARLGKNAKLLMIFDTPQHSQWLTDEKVSEKGIELFLRKFQGCGIPFEDMSAVCLVDKVHKPSAADYKYKLPYIEELIETYGFNLIMTVGASAFEKVTKLKGAAKYFGKIVQAEISRTECTGEDDDEPIFEQVSHKFKVLACPNPAQAKYDPTVMTTITEAVRIAAEEKEFPEFKEKERLPTQYTIIDTMEKFYQFIDLYFSPEVRAFAYDLETTGLHFKLDQILTIQFSHKPGSSYLIPTDFYEGYWTPKEWAEIVSCIKTLFADESKTLVGHHKKFDDKFINHHWKIPVRKRNVFDTMIASFVCDENTPNDLKYLACVLTDLGDYELELERFKEKYCKEHKIRKKEFSYGMIPFNILSQYALTDTDATIRLFHHYVKVIQQEEQWGVFNMVMRFSYLLTKMEINGWPVDVEWAKKYDKQLEEGIAELITDLSENEYIKKAVKLLAGRKLEAVNKTRKNRLSELKEEFTFNFASAPQKKVLFFEIMKLKILKYTKTKDENGKRTTPAADKEVLDLWIDSMPEHQELLLKIKKLGVMQKVKATYVKAVLTKAVDGRIYPTYNATGAKTGRLSSKEPNLQNIQAKGDDKLVKLLGFDTSKDVKKLFKALMGWVMLGSDLSAAEMRYACVCSGDVKLIDIFLRGIDIHCAIAKELFDYIPRDITDEELKVQFKNERNIAKTVQFLSLYGGGADALAKKAKITVERAQEILDDYFRKYSGVDRYIKETIRFVEIHGYSLSLLGRKRRVPGVGSIDEAERAKAIRQAVNATIQSIASDGLLISACNLLDEIEDNGLPITMLGPIHDALYVEADENFKSQARDRILHHLQQFPIPSPIPMVAECEWGRSWAEFSEDFGDTSLADQYDDEEEDEELEEAA